MTIKYEDLSPLRLMRDSERREAEKLMNGQSVLWYGRKAVVGLSRRKRIRARLGSTSWEAIRAGLRKIAEEVLARDLGLQRYMVVRVDRDGGRSWTLQVLESSIETGRYWSWQWRIDGRNVRKDGTLGLQDAAATFASAHVERRLLDGTWRMLRPRLQRLISRPD